MVESHNPFAISNENPELPFTKGKAPYVDLDGCRNTQDENFSEDEELDFQFKDQVKAAPVAEDVAESSISQAIYFKIVEKRTGPGDDYQLDNQFMIHECSPKDTLSNIQNFAPTKLPETLTFYLEAKRLP